MRLSHKVYDRLLRVLPRLYVSRTIRNFYEHVVTTLPGLIEGDGYGWFVHSFGPNSALIDLVESEPRIITPAMRPRMGQAARSHPFALHWASAKAIATLKFSDFPLKDRLRHISENWDIHRDMGKEYLSIPVTVSTAGIHAVTVRRDRKWFTEEDRLVMDLLAPHLRQGHTNAQAFEQAMARGGVSNLALKTAMTPREAEVGLWVAHGKTNREIGMILGISARTIDKHIEHLLKKLHVENRATAAVRIAQTLRIATHVPERVAAADPVRPSPSL